MLSEADVMKKKNPQLSGRKDPGQRKIGGNINLMKVVGVYISPGIILSKDATLRLNDQLEGVRRD